MNLIVSAVAAVIVVVFAWRELTRPAAGPAREATAASCTPEAIRQVADALERSVLSAQCAKREAGPAKR